MITLLFLVAIAAAKLQFSKDFFPKLHFSCQNLFALCTRVITEDNFDGADIKYVLRWQYVLNT